MTHPMTHQRLTLCLPMPHLSPTYALCLALCMALLQARLRETQASVTGLAQQLEHETRSRSLAETSLAKLEVQVTHPSTHPHSHTALIQTGTAPNSDI